MFSFSIPSFSLMFKQGNKVYPASEKTSREGSETSSNSDHLKDKKQKYKSRLAEIKQLARTLDTFTDIFSLDIDDETRDTIKSITSKYFLLRSSAIAAEKKIDYNDKLCRDFSNLFEPFCEEMSSKILMLVNTMNKLGIDGDKSYYLIMLLSYFCFQCYKMCFFYEKELPMNHHNKKSAEQYCDKLLANFMEMKQCLEFHWDSLLDNRLPQHPFQAASLLCGAWIALHDHKNKFENRRALSNAVHNQVVKYMKRLDSATPYYEEHVVQLIDWIHDHLTNKDAELSDCSDVELPFFWSTSNSSNEDTLILSRGHSF